MTKIVRIILITFILGDSAALLAHPLHLTITNIDFFNDSIKVAIRIFADDYNSLNLNSTDSNSVYQADESDTQLNNILDYLKQNFGVNINNQTINLNYLYKEIEDISVWLYFKAEFKSTGNEILIENKLFIDKFSDQKNMVIVSNNGIETGLEFSPSDTKKSITLGQ